MTPLPKPFARPGMAAAALLAAGVAVCGPAHASVPDPSPFDGLEPIDVAELGEARGGMMINGIPVQFALVMRTMVDEAMPRGLETVLTVNETGAVGSVTTRPIGTVAGGVVVSATPAGIALGLPAGTTITHEIQAGHVSTLIANTQDNVKVTHDTTLNVTLPNFTELSKAWYTNNTAARMGTAAALSGLGSR